MGPSRSNCWLVARALRRRRPNDTWFAIRRSDHFSLIPHLGVIRRLKDGRVRLLHYRPLQPVSGWRVLLDAFYFRGRIHINRDPHG